MTNGKSPLSQSAVILKSTWILQTSSPFDAKDMCLIEQPGICDFLLMKLILYCGPSKNITDEHYMKIRGQTYENIVKMNIIVNPFAASVPLLYPLKSSENRTGTQKWNITLKWVTRKGTCPKMSPSVQEWTK